MKKTLTRKYVTVEELDALARERLATHHALETARFSLASEDVRNEIVLSLHRSKSSSSLSLSSSSFNGGENDEKDDVDGKNARENDEAFKRKDALSRKTLKIALCDSSRMMREWLKAREVDLFEERVRLNAVRGLPEEVDFEDGVLFDEEKEVKEHEEEEKERCYWFPFEKCRRLIRARKVTIMKRGQCLVRERLVPYVWFAAYEDYLEEDLERAFREKRFALANNAFDVGLKDVCDRLKVWRPDVDEDDGGGVHPLMALATKHLLERNKILMKNATAGNKKNLKYGGTENWGVVRRDSRRKKQRLGGGGGIMLEYEDENGKMKTYHSRKPSKELKRSLKVIKEGATGAHAKVFPPCMRDVMDELHVKKHLRHFKRYELNLFLKGIGLPLEEIFKVWRSAVFPHGAMGNYQNEHTYQLRHVFGLEGQMKEKFEHDCEKLIKTSQMEPHAAKCPFAMPLNQYRALNANDHRWKREISIDANREIEMKVSRGDYKSACESYFSHKHKGEKMFNANVRYPTDFFDAGMEIEDWFRDAKEERLKQLNASKKENLEDESFQIEKEKNTTTLLAIKDDPDLMIESSSSDDDSDIDDGENNPNRFRGELIVSDSDD
jgi:DNA primase large subunit